MARKIEIGVTGTQYGMTDKQQKAVRKLIASLVENFNVVALHHGDCVGSDEQFHHLMRKVAPSVSIWGHIPIDDSKRAFCKVDYSYSPLPYLARNRQIVSHSDVIIATPGTSVEVLRSGTWSTIRHTRKLAKPRYVFDLEGELIKDWTKEL